MLKEQVMRTFEQVGRRIDRELKKLRRFFETEVKPATEEKAVKALRMASKRLAEVAEELAARAARKKK
jgi:hypothetical protein